MIESNEIDSRVKVVLDELETPFDIIECDPAFADTAAFCERYGYRLEECVNTILIASKRGERRYSACLIKGSERLDVNKTVRKLMGASRVSFASTEETVDLTGMMVGGITPFALPVSIHIYVDLRVMALDKVILGSGIRSSKIMIPPKVLNVLPNTRIVDGLSVPETPSVN